MIYCTSVRPVTVISMHHLSLYNYAPCIVSALFVYLDMAEMPNSICTCIDIFAPDSHVFDRKGAWSS